MRKSLRFKLFEEKFYTHMNALPLMIIKAKFFLTTLFSLSDASINTNATYANFINSNLLKTQICRSITSATWKQNKTMINASSYFILNGRPSVIKYLFLEFKLFSMTTMKNLHF